MKESGYPKDVRAGEDGFRRGRGSENAAPKRTTVKKSNGGHARSVQHALEGDCAGGKSHAGMPAVNANTRPPGTGKGKISSRGSLKYAVAGKGVGGPRGENAYGYDGHYSRGKLHGWDHGKTAGKEKTHPEAHHAIEGGQKHDHKVQLPAGVPHAHHMHGSGSVAGAHGFGHGGGQRLGVHRLSGHSGGHMLGRRGRNVLIDK